MRRYILIFLLTILALPAVADNVTNVRVRQEGKTIVVTYDLEYISDVRLLMSSAGSSEYVELNSVTGDVGRVTNGENRQIVWSPLDEYDSFVAKGVKFKVDATSVGRRIAKKEKTQKEKTRGGGLKNMKTLVAAQMGYSIAPQLNGGLLFGQMYNGVGWYVNMRSNFKSRPENYNGAWCRKDGGVDHYNPFYSGGEVLKTHLTLDAGFMMDFLKGVAQKPFNTFGFYIGGGYGHRNLYLPTRSGEWVKYNATSTTGFSGNLGLFGSWNRVTLNVGVNTINFIYTDVEFGLGIMF
jgi:hypothetical protein